MVACVTKHTHTHTHTYTNTGLFDLIYTEIPPLSHTNLQFDSRKPALHFWLSTAASFMASPFSHWNSGYRGVKGLNYSGLINKYDERRGDMRERMLCETIGIGLRAAGSLSLSAQQGVCTSGLGPRLNTLFRTSLFISSPCLQKTPARITTETHTHIHITSHHVSSPHDTQTRTRTHTHTQTHHIASQCHPLCPRV